MKFETHRPKAYLLCHPVAGIVVFSNDPIRGVSRQPDFDPGLNLRRDSVCGVRRSAARTRGVHVIGVLAQKFALKVARHFFAPPCGPFIELGQIVPCAPGLQDGDAFRMRLASNSFRSAFDIPWPWAFLIFGFARGG